MTTATPPTPSPTITRPQLRRSGTDRMLGGVCGGLADYSGIDPVLWRVGFVAMALLGPGIIVYLLLWVLMPSAPLGPDVRQNVVDEWAGKLHDRVTAGRSAPPSAG